MLLYHGVPQRMMGTKLYPLNELKNVHSELSAEYCEKYSGREKVMEQVIPILNCLWNDVIFFIPIAPEAINVTRESHGLPPIKREWFVVDSKTLDQSNLLLFRHRPQWAIDAELEKDEYARLDGLSVIQETDVQMVPECAIWAMKKFGRKSMLFSYMPHVLFRGTIETKNLERIHT